MLSTFFGLEIGKKGMFASRVGLDVTGQNIANANTAGYSRQDIVLKNLGPLSNTLGIIGNIGMGVDIVEIRQTRDFFIDSQLREQLATRSYWESLSGVLNKVELVLMEPGENGIRSLLDRFWSALEDLANTPDSLATRQAVVQSGISLTEGVKEIYSRIKELQNSFDNEIRTKVKNINSLLKNIAAINLELKKFERENVKANDLRDERGRLMDELAKLVDIKVFDTDRIEQGRIMINNHMAVSDDYYDELVIQERDPSRQFIAVSWKKEAVDYSSNPLVVSGYADPSASEGAHVVRVEQLATRETVYSGNSGIRRASTLAGIPGIRGGTIYVNGVEILVDPETTTMEELAKAITDSGAGVTAAVTLSDTLQLTANETGSAHSITLRDGTSNILEKFGLVASREGNSIPPITDINASLNIGGEFSINGNVVRIVMGQTDTLASIRDQINALGIDVEASIIKNSKGQYSLKLTSKTNREFTILESTTGGVLHRLGLLSTAGGPETVSGPRRIEAQDAVFTVDGNLYSRSSNQVDDVLPGFHMVFNSTGMAEIRAMKPFNSGQLQALFDARDVAIPGYLAQINKFVSAFVNAFNNQHYNGFGMDGKNHRDFFTDIPPSDAITLGRSPIDFFSVSEEIIADPTRLGVAGMDTERYLATGEVVSRGRNDNTNVLALSRLRFEKIIDGKGTLSDFIESFVSGIGIQVETAKRLYSNQDKLVGNLENYRAEVSGVSLDEEMTNLIKYQQSFAANARVINAVDQMISTIINNLGR